MTNMHLTRLRVEQLRQFRQPYVLDNLTSGLNIFSGPNEAGKSTLVRAIRAAFFERHRSTSVEDLRPWADSAASPTVEIDFAFNGKNFQLAKTFFSKKRCDLRVGTQAMEGVDAEDYLANLFGFAFAGKGASKAEHWGIPGLLWVEQGSGQDLDVSHARNQLQTALGSQSQNGVVNSLAATGGDELLAHLQEQRSALLTQAGKPRAAYAQVCEQVDNLAQQLGALEAQITRYQQQVDELARLRQQHLEDAQQKPWDAMQTQLNAALAKQLELDGLRQRLDADNATLTQLKQTKELLSNQIAAFDVQDRNAGDRAQESQKTQTQYESAEQAATTSRLQTEQARARAQVARDVLRLARQESTRATLTGQLQDAKDKAKKLELSLEKAELAEASLLELRSSSAAKQIAKKDVATLVELDHAAREAHIKLQAVATRVRFDLSEGAQIEVSGIGKTHKVTGQTELLLHTETVLQLPGLGSLRIGPGGEDLVELDRQNRDASQNLLDALQRLGVPDLVSAQQRLSDFNDLSTQIRLAEQLLNSHAPQGCSNLRVERDTALGKATQTQEALDLLPPPNGQPAQSLHEAEQEQQAADGAEQACNDNVREAELASATAKSRAEQAEAEMTAAKAVLDDPARANKLLKCSEDLLSNQAAQRALQARIDETDALWNEANPELVAQDIKRLSLSLERIQQDHRKRHESILLLQNTLELAGAQGLEEQQQALSGELNRAQKRKSELARRAAALGLLCDKLQAKRHATLQRLQAPLLQRLQHYLQLLFPGATMELDEHLAPQKLIRNQVSGQTEVGSVDALSFGAREQLGLLSRFAYADLLASAGKPTLLILDDALVHSDEVRLAQMKRVIFDASQRHQVLLFTCHPNIWRDLGSSVRGIGLSVD